jgi:hypothetical protein
MTKTTTHKDVLETKLHPMKDVFCVELLYNDGLAGLTQPEDIVRVLHTLDGIRPDDIKDARITVAIEYVKAEDEE